MKNLAILFALALLASFNLSGQAQVPQAFRFQSVLRDATGNFITTPITVRLSILSGSPSGTSIYQHVEPAITPTNGVISVNMGTDNPTDFAAIDWAAGPYFLKVEMIPPGGSSYVEVGAPVQVLSVPYALYAEHGGDNPWTIGTDSLFYHENAVSIGKPGAGNVLLDLNSERNWQFRQYSTGQSTALELASVGGGGNKSFIINTTGNVGIGTLTTPTAPLTVANDTKALIEFKRGSATGAIEQNTSGGALRLENATGDDIIQLRTYGHSFFNGGNVGIGVNNPGDKLSVNGNISLPSDDHILARGDNGVFAIYKNSNATDSRTFIELHGNTTNRVGELTLAGTYLSFRSNSTTTSTGTERMRVTADGNVGIGTTNPTKAKLEINGSQVYNIGNYGWFNVTGGSGTCNGCSATSYSIWTSNRIAAQEFNAFSDERIKNIKGISNSPNDLRTLMGIEVTDYSLVDTIEKGNKAYKKAIAQQVEKIYPQAVSTTTDVVPDIYRIATIKEGRIAVPNTLKAGEKVKLIFKDRAELADVISADAKGFKVNLSDEGQVFVFGREVSDFRTVDYEAISMLNVSATQELAKIIEQQRAEIASLQSTNVLMMTRLEQLEAKLSNPQKTPAETGASK